MKEVVLKPRPAARGSVGEEGVRRALPVKKLVLKERPIARGTAGLMGLRRAVRSGGAAGVGVGDLIAVLLPKAGAGVGAHVVEDVVGHRGGAAGAPPAVPAQ